MDSPEVVLPEFSTTELGGVQLDFGIEEMKADEGGSIAAMVVVAIIDGEL
jgi:hypothetical protein